MARNAPEPSRRTTSRVTKQPVQKQAQHRPARTRQDRRRFWTQVVAGLLVLAMLLPVVAFLFA